MKIWVLLDGRAGNDSQTIGLANAIDKSYEVINIKYNRLSLLPNILLGKSIITVTNKQDISNLYPDMVIAAGRKLAPVALHIKKQNPKTKLIHIMWPEIYAKDFDLIISPTHDDRKANNIVEITGAIHKLTEENLNKARENFAHITQNLPRPYISILVGGSSKDKKFTRNDGIALIENLKIIHQKKGGSFLITTSRRTPNFIFDMLNELQFSKYIYAPGQTGQNPYIAILAFADIIVTTGDSISMCSEACFIGKPVYIYANSNFCADKHLKFHQNLYDTNHALKLASESNFEISNIQKLDEIEKVKNKLNLLLD